MARSRSLTIRPAQHQDIAAIRQLVKKAYAPQSGYTLDQLRVKRSCQAISVRS